MSTASVSLLAQADTVSDLVHVAPDGCAKFVDGLGLPEVKAKRLLAAFGVAQGAVLSAHMSHPHRSGTAPTPATSASGLASPCATPAPR